MKKTGCLSGFLGTVISLVATVVLSIFLTPQLTKLIIGARFDGQIACASLKLATASFIVYFVIAEVIFFTWQAGRIRKEEKKGDGSSDAKFSKITRIIYAASLAAILLFNVIYVNTYTEYRDDSISEKFFVTTKKYEWNDVLRYTLHCKSDGELTFTVAMKDGETFELFQTVTSCSDEFLDKYDSNMLAYATHLANEFDAQDNFIEKRISGKDYMRELYEDDYPDVWKYLVEIADEELANDGGSGEGESDTTE